MVIDFMFIINSVLFGIGLAMDAFSVSLANGLNEPKMRRRKMFLISGMFAFFQALMPMIGWACVHTIVQYFKAFEKAVPWIALILLLYIGGKMLYDGIKQEEEKEKVGLGFASLIVQGVATSIDALSVGFQISSYNFLNAIVCAVIIAITTLIICYFGIIIGKKFGTKLADKAQIFGGSILIFIGIEIFVSSFF